MPSGENVDTEPDERVMEIAAPVVIEALLQIGGEQACRPKSRRGQQRRYSPGEGRLYHMLGKNPNSSRDLSKMLIASRT